MQKIRESLDLLAWGGSGIERAFFDWILATFPAGSKVLELGAGFCSTKGFSLCYETYSVDDNMAYLNLHEGVSYVFAPIQDGWYDRKIIDAIPKDYDFIFVDGPAGTGRRSGILKNLDVLRNDVPILFHDTNRPKERDLVFAVAEKLRKHANFFDEGDFWGIVR